MKKQALGKARQIRWAPPSTVTSLAPSTPSTEQSYTIVTPDGEVAAEKLTGASYDKFVEDRLDFRCWGTLTHKGFRESGDFSGLMKLFID